MVDVNICRPRKAVIRALRKTESLSCGIDSKTINYQLALKKRKQAKKKKRADEYESCDKIVAKREELLRAETSRYKQAMIRLSYKREDLLTYILDVARIPEKYYDNAMYKIDQSRNLIDIFFGGFDGTPKGPKHGHYTWDIQARRLIYHRNPGEPKIHRKKKERYELYAADEYERAYA